ncbi:preprotein translocase subunit SecY [bacterium]|nr:preprotein translocase subunit SecY [bacterium]
MSEAFSSPELKKRVGFTALGLLVFTLGSHIPLPGINHEALGGLFGEGGILNLLDMFSGGALKRFSIFALGIMPYINASIMMQVLTYAIPSLEELQKERGEEGRRLIGKWTRYLTVVVAVIQGISFLALFRQGGILSQTDTLHLGIIIITLVAGTTFLMWLGDEMTEKGIGNGVSLLIFAGIVMRFPTMIAQQIQIVRENPAAAGAFVFFGLFLLLLVTGIVFIQLAERRIPIRYSTRTVGRQIVGGQVSYLPVRIDIAGVIPIIFAISALLIPQTLSNFIPSWQGPVGQFLGSPWYYLVLGGLVLFFTFLYSSITFKPDDIAKNLKKGGGFIPGIRPGKNTEEFIAQVQEKITLIGALYLAIVAVLPQMIANAANVSQFAIGGTGLIIVVGVSLDTMRQLEAHVVSRQYKGFLKT